MVSNFILDHVWALPKHAKSVASMKMKVRIFKPSLDNRNLDDLKAPCYAPASESKDQWACKAYIDWWKACLETNPDCEEDIKLADLTIPDKLEKGRFARALHKFMTEVWKHNEADYPPNSLKEIIACIQMNLCTKKIHWRLLDEHDTDFGDLFNVVDNLMKDRLSKRMGKVESATPSSVQMENSMWINGVLG